MALPYNPDRAITDKPVDNYLIMELLKPEDSLQPDLRSDNATVQIKTRVSLVQAQQIDVMAAVMNVTRSAFLRECLNWFFQQYVPRSLLKTLNKKEHRDRVRAYGDLVEIKRLLQDIAATNCPIDDQLLLETQQLVRQAIRVTIGLPFDPSIIPADCHTEKSVNLQ